MHTHERNSGAHVNRKDVTENDKKRKRTKVLKACWREKRYK
jgi:hypothetical protein